jgi:CO/xanthine dehydrogenase FAD-binding subunit
MLPEFEFVMPRSLDDALQVLAVGSPDVLPIAGGTNLTVDMRSGRYEPKVVVNIEKLPELSGIRRENGQICVGGGVKIAELLKDGLIAETAPVLKAACAVFASPLIRNRATVGGNLVDGSPAADTAPSLLALDAEVELTSQEGRRRIPLDEFFIHVRKTARQPNEVVTALRWAVPKPGTGSAFYKLGLRKADAISVVSVAVVLEVEKDVCRKARIALGSVAPRPIRAKNAEQFLIGKVLSRDVFEEAAALAAQAVSPISDVRASAEYRRRMSAVLTRRMLAQAAERAGWKE